MAYHKKTNILFMAYYKFNIYQVLMLVNQVLWVKPLVLLQ